MIKIKSNKIIIGETLFDGYMYALNGKSPKFPRKISLARTAMITRGNTYRRGLSICIPTVQADTRL